ncbi:MAG: hypothetical protein G01um101433_1038 [Parcubacteria group bacterium Gr01-1014_33]|nr:MAG: hypothetical protein G01um101433_1038 [Parcubacteria group bacterium Gr01-1014_33]
MALEFPEKGMTGQENEKKAKAYQEEIEAGATHFQETKAMWEYSQGLRTRGNNELADKIEVKMEELYKDSEEIAKKVEENWEKEKGIVDHAVIEFAERLHSLVVDAKKEPVDLSKIVASLGTMDSMTGRVLREIKLLLGVEGVPVIRKSQHEPEREDHIYPTAIEKLAYQEIQKNSFIQRRILIHLDSYDWSKLQNAYRQQNEAESGSESNELNAADD